MRCVIRQFQVLCFEETTIDTSKLGESEAFVRWLAAPVNPSDLRQIVGVYGVLPSSFPAVPGIEAAGVVEKVSTLAGTDTHAGHNQCPGAKTHVRLKLPF